MQTSELDPALVDRLMAELRQTVLHPNATADSVIVDSDVDLDALLATLPPARHEPDKPSA